MNKRRLHHLLLFILLSVSVLIAGWLSLTHPYNIDLRDQPIWHISKAQSDALKTLPDVTIEVFVTHNPRLRRSIDELLTPLKLQLPTLQVIFYNPETKPVLVRKRGISREGQLYVRDDQGHGQLVSTPSPDNLLQATLALQPNQARQIIHLQGAGERGFLSDDAGSWRDTYLHLKQAGITIAAADPASIATIPTNTNVLVIADPILGSLDNQALITDYIKQGGNLLYTTDQPTPYLPTWLAKLSGLNVIFGITRDPDGRQYGIEDPQMLLITTLGAAEVVSTLDNAPLLAQATAIMPEGEPAGGWLREPLLYTSDQTTVENNGHVVQGSVVTGWMLERPHNGHTQRIIILGDSDLFSQHYRKIAGNAALADNIINALLPDNTVLAAAKPIPLTDQYITLDDPYLYSLSVLLLLALPLAWIFYYQYYQRKQKCRYQ